MTENTTASGAAGDSLLLCASDLQHSAIYDNPHEMVDCVRAVADRITALAAFAPVAPTPPDWRELCRRLYVELFHCDKQMTCSLNEDGEPIWRTGPEVRDVLSDAKAALEANPITPEAAPVAPTKMPIPPSPADPLDVVYAEGWNAACEAFFGGKPPADALVITVTVAAPAPQPAAPKAGHIPEAGKKVAPLQQGEYPATGNPEADRVLGRLNSSDPEFDDCAEAAALIYKLVAEIKGPEGFSTWKDAAVYERGLRATLETTINTASPLAYLYTDGKHPGLDFEHAPAEDLRPGFVCIPLAAAHRAARGAAQAAPAMDAKQLGDAVVKWLGCETTKTRGDTGEPERRIDVSVERLGFAVAAVLKTVTAPAPVTDGAVKALHDAMADCRKNGITIDASVMGFFCNRLNEQPAPVAEDADPLQGAANWLVECGMASNPTGIGVRLCIGYNRAERLFSTARAQAAQPEGGANANR